MVLARASISHHKINVKAHSSWYNHMVINENSPLYAVDKVAVVKILRWSYNELTLKHFQ